MHLRSLFLCLTSLGVAACLLPTGARADEIADKFAQFDTNHDGVLSGDELNAAPYLRQLDLNGDGKVTLDEAREGMARLRGGILKKLAEKLTGGGESSATSNDTAASSTVGDGKLAVELLFKRLDKNGDGKLTPDELTDKKWFEKLDLNKDGVVTLEEAQQVLSASLAGASRRGFGHNSSTTASFTEADMAPLTEQPPHRSEAGDRGVGRKVDALTLKDLQGRDVPLTAMNGSKAMVLALFSATCPISNKLGPELARIETAYANQHVTMFLVNIAPETKVEDVRKFVTSFG